MTDLTMTLTDPAAGTETVFTAQQVRRAKTSKRRRPMESRADPTLLYLNPEGKYELKRYALELGPKVKVHDLLMEALEQWAAGKGITAPMRVPSEKPRRG